ncbi:hypothetical protein LTR85_008002 [Meristemomyces frigidus]|nr:hypothetical protein LTR85_008002 [Meristemomyces frigidus]
MADLIRDAPLGQLLRYISRKKLFMYPEERAGFEIPIQYVIRAGAEKLAEGGSSAESPLSAGSESADEKTLQRQVTTIDAELESLGMTRTKSKHYSLPYSSDRVAAEGQLALERTKSIPIIPQTTSDGIILVDWYTTDDPENPHNWSSGKRGFVTFLICAYTWVVYTGSSIYAPSEGGVVDQFGVSPLLASLPLSLYVLAYGVGPFGKVGNTVFQLFLK